jgi:hypothetical protein
VVRSQPGQIVRETLSQKKPSQKWADGVAQDVGLSSSPRPSTTKKKKEEEEEEKKSPLVISENP